MLHTMTTHPADHTLAAQLAEADGELLLRTREDNACIDPRELKDMGHAWVLPGARAGRMLVQEVITTR